MSIEALRKKKRMRRPRPRLTDGQKSAVLLALTFFEGWLVGFAGTHSRIPSPVGTPQWMITGSLALAVGHAMTPKRTVRAEERLFAEFRLKYPQAKPFQCPVRLEAEFWMSHRGRPDLDNLLKLVLDSLNGVAYVDDAQVVESHASKRMPDLWVYGSKGRYRKRKSGDPYTCCGHEYEPHLSIRIKPLPEWEPNKQGEQS